MKYELEDAHERNRQYPITFEIPSSMAVAKLKRGDFAKLIFKTNDPWVESERMWVLIHSKNGDKFSGELNNDPVFTNIECGAKIEFEARHIAGVLSQ